MKIITGPVLIAIFFIITNLYLTFTSVAVELVNYPDGYGSIKWGTKIDTLDNMEFVKSGNTTQGEIKIYRNKKDTLDYDGIKLNDIEYGFNKDELIFVALKTTGADNWKELKEYTVEKYGRDFRKFEDFGYQNYVWQGTYSTIALEYKPKQGSSVVLLIVSNKSSV